MKNTRKRARPAAKRRPSNGKRSEPLGVTALFLRKTFCYLKGEQFLRTSNQLLCETA